MKNRKKSSSQKVRGVKGGKNKGKNAEKIGKEKEPTRELPEVGATSEGRKGNFGDIGKGRTLRKDGQIRKRET